MCGIAGLININASAERLGKEELEDIDSAVKVQKHRGPDDTGVCALNFKTKKSYAAAGAAEIDLKNEIDGVIGFNRLSIKDLSIEGHQPMTALDGRVILAFNGEIYNDVELREELINIGYRFRSSSDTEVIMNLYLEYGFESMIPRLNGMFAIVIADLRYGTVWIARDRFGIKPLYYTIYLNRIAFASELKSIIQFRDFERRLDMDAFNARLIFSRPSEKVLLKDVELVEPGQAIRITYDADIKKWKFYNINQYEREEEKYKSIAEAMEATEAVITSAVSRQMVSDVKVGCQLSGGIDSTLVSYFANQNKGANLNDAVSIIDEKGVIGEEQYIDYVGSRLSLDLHKFTIEEDYFLNNYERMIWHNDAPVYQPFFVCFLKLAERAKDYVTVLLSGEGSDETAGGYTRFATGVYQPFLKKMGGSGNLKSYDSYAHYAVMTDQTITNLVSEGYNGLERLIGEQVDLFNSFTGSDFTKHLKFEITERLPEALLRQDKMTMASSIENRVPLLDNEVVDHVMRLPEDMLVRFASCSPLNLSDNPLEWVQGKYIYKEIVANKFGTDFAYRKKQIMALDKRTMVTSEGFRNYFYDVIYPNMRNRGLLNADKIKNSFENARLITNAEFTSMWRAIALETWCQLFLGQSRNLYAK
ncbi:MAG: asparagine synthase (glutamine-hydrolyzing) [Lachnospiraceae bacterium]|nr:asparagine synthase (glutamine-hydrolyzing) [Lachnospiraceae bacterium]